MHGSMLGTRGGSVCVSRLHYRNTSGCRKHKSDNIHIVFPPYAPSAALSMYAPMLKAWSEHVPLDQMRIVNYQSLVDGPLDIVNQMLRYLGAASLEVQILSLCTTRKCPKSSLSVCARCSPQKPEHVE